MINTYNNSPEPGRYLSCFQPCTFLFDDVLCNSMTSFIESLKFYGLGDQRCVCVYAPWRAAGAGQEKDEELAGAEREWVYWRGRRIPVHSEEHYTLVKRALVESFKQCPIRFQALLETLGQELEYRAPDYTDPSTILPKEILIQLLNEVRAGFTEDWSQDF